MSKAETVETHGTHSLPSSADKPQGNERPGVQGTPRAQFQNGVPEAHGRNAQPACRPSIAFMGLPEDPQPLNAENWSLL